MTGQEYFQVEGRVKAKGRQWIPILHARHATLEEAHVEMTRQRIAPIIGRAPMEYRIVRITAAVVAEDHGEKTSE